MAGSLNLPALAPLRTAFGFDQTIHRGLALRIVDIAPQHHLAPIALLGRAGFNGGARCHGDGGGLAHIAAALPVATHQHRAAAGGAVGVNLAGGGQLNVLSHQHNFAALVGQAGGAQLPTVFDHRALQGGQSIGRQNDLPAFSQHGLAVFNQGRHGLRRGGDAGQPGCTTRRARVVKTERDGLARSQGHSARLRHDDALVAHLGCQQSNVAAQRSLQLAFVDHAGCRPVAMDGGLTRHEVIGVEAARGGHQAAHIDLRRWRKIHPIGVAQKDLTVGADLPINQAGIVAKHLIQHHRAAVGLVELDFGIAAHIEAGPINDRAVAGLVDAHQRAERGLAAGNAGQAATDHPTLRQLGAGRGRLLRVYQKPHAAQHHGGHKVGHNASPALGGG